MVQEIQAHLWGDRELKGFIQGAGQIAEDLNPMAMSTVREEIQVTQMLIALRVNP